MRKSSRNTRTRNLYLLGYMGSGKSHTGVLLAERLERPLVDLDARLEAMEGCSIAQLFEHRGEAYFRRVEAAAVRATLQEAPCVVALGGGAPLYHDTMNWLLDHGTTVFLDPPIDVLLSRLHRDGTAVRPLLANTTSEQLRQHVETMLAQRRPIYTQAHHHITDCDEVVQAILTALEE